MNNQPRCFKTIPNARCFISNKNKVQTLDKLTPNTIIDKRFQRKIRIWSLTLDKNSSLMSFKFQQKNPNIGEKVPTEHSGFAYYIVWFFELKWLRLFCLLQMCINHLIHFLTISFTHWPKYHWKLSVIDFTKWIIATQLINDCLILP